MTEAHLLVFSILILPLTIIVIAIVGHMMGSTAIALFLLAVPSIIILLGRAYFFQGERSGRTGRNGLDRFGPRENSPAPRNNSQKRP